jgi:hypothetical protein
MLISNNTPRLDLMVLSTISLWVCIKLETSFPIRYQLPARLDSYECSTTASTITSFDVLLQPFRNVLPVDDRIKIYVLLLICCIKTVCVVSTLTHAYKRDRTIYRYWLCAILIRYSLSLLLSLLLLIVVDDNLKSYC